MAQDNFGKTIEIAKDIIDQWYLLSFISKNTTPANMQFMALVIGLRGRNFNIPELLDIIISINPEFRPKAEVLAFNYYLATGKTKEWWRFLHKLVENKND